MKKCQNAWIYKHPPACKSPHGEMEILIAFGPSLASARCAKVYESKKKKNISLSHLLKSFFCSDLVYEEPVL